MSSSAVISGIDGASRMSSVLGLKVRPSTAMVLPRRLPPSAADDLARHARLRLSLTAEHRLDDAQRHVVILRGLDQRAACPWESTSRRSPVRHAGTSTPMRLSSPMPRATSCTSAPTFSHRSAISLMKVILVARKALAAYLISSAVRRLVNSIGAWLR